ncbi:hypothetical protein WN943_001493 [Citrus x changshan-huyou]
MVGNWQLIFSPFSMHADLLNVFEVFIPQFHLYHNPCSLLNGEAVGVITQLCYSYSKSERQSSFSIELLDLLLNGEAAGVITQLCYSYSKSERQSSFSI